MKNRKLFIISFLVVATLVTGVGFAVLNGSLDVSGTARFIGSGAAAAEIREAINFTAANAGPTNVIASLTNITAGNVSKTADMTVEFHDLDANTNGSTYTAYADFTIQYGDANAKDVLPKINLCKLDGTGVEHDSIVTITAGSGVKGEFSIDAYWVDKVGEDAVNKGKDAQVLSAGDTRIMRVVVTYTEDTTQDHPDDSFSANINVTLPFHTVDNTSGS